MNRFVGVAAWLPPLDFPSSAVPAAPVRGPVPTPDPVTRLIEEVTEPPADR